MLQRTWHLSNRIIEKKMEALLHENTGVAWRLRALASYVQYKGLHCDATQDLQWNVIFTVQENAQIARMKALEWRVLHSLFVLWSIRKCHGGRWMTKILLLYLTRICSRGLTTFWRIAKVTVYFISWLKQIGCLEEQTLKHWLGTSRFTKENDTPDFNLGDWVWVALIILGIFLDHIFSRRGLCITRNYM